MSKLCKFKKILVFPALLLAVSCSLNYGTEQDSEASVPEFTFTRAVFNRYENSKISLSLQSERLEQYKSDGSSYAKNAQFKTYTKDGDLDTDGFCSLLAAHPDDEIYTLFDGISINIYSQKMTLKADSLRFNGKTEQLTSGEDEVVSIERDGTSAAGRGFSASGVSRKYSFAEQISGTVIDNEDSQLSVSDGDSLQNETDDGTDSKESKGQ